MEQIAIIFGNVLRMKRKEIGLTQEQLAFESDLQRVYISILELGHQQPSLSTILKLAKGLNCPAAELIEAVEDKINQY